MKIAMNSVLLDENCAPITVGGKMVNGVMVGGRLYTLGTHCASVLLNSNQDSIDAAEKINRFDLWMKIRDKEEVDLDSSEVAHLQRLAGEISTTLVLGQVRELLEGRANPLTMNGKKSD